MRNSIFFAFLITTFYANAQAQPRESIESKATEVWENKPKKIDANPTFAEPPSDAIILFSGKDLNGWLAEDGSAPKWELKDGVMTVVKGTGEIKTKKTFGDVQLHIEWRTPAKVEGDGQNRGNSGVFLQDRYEVQVLDMYDNDTYYNGQAGAIYKQSIPMVNATRKPGEWQVYDIIYTAPRFSDDGRAIIPAYITVLHNGVIIQNHIQIWGTTENKGIPIYTAHGKASLKLQDHGSPVSYRNIWLREL
jgi:hypothetical protein